MKNASRARHASASTRVMTHIIAMTAAAFAALGGGLIVASSATATPGEDEGMPNITICHATHSDDNPYEQISPALPAVLETHATHQDNEDIIPEFWYSLRHKDVTYVSTAGYSHFEGMNWGSANQSTYRNDCRHHDEHSTPSASASLTCAVGLAVQVSDYPRRSSLEITLDGNTSTPSLTNGAYTYPSSPFTTGVHSALVRIMNGQSEQWATLLDTSVDCGTTNPALFGASGEFCSPAGVVTTYSTPVVFATQAQADADLAARTTGLTTPVNGSCGVTTLYGASGTYCSPDGTAALFSVPSTYATQADADAALAALVVGLSTPVNGVCAVAGTPLPGTVEQTEAAAVAPQPATVVTPLAATAGDGSRAPVAPWTAWALLGVGLIGLVGSGLRYLANR